MNKTKWLFVVLILLVLLFIAFFVRNVKANEDNPKVTICHKTDSNTNPWVEQVINANELESHIAKGDFLVDKDHPCPPKPTPTPTTKPSPTPTIKPCKVDVDWEEVTPCPSPTEEVTPSATPSAQPTDTPNNGGSSGGDGRSDGLSSCPDCTKAHPGGGGPGPTSAPMTGRAEN